MKLVSVRTDPWTRQVICSYCGATLEITTSDLHVTYLVPQLASAPHQIRVEILCPNCREKTEIRDLVPTEVLYPLIRKAEKKPIKGGDPIEGHVLS